MNYLLDANIFIEAKRRYYGMDICPGFWDWLDHAKETGLVASITLIRDELAEGGDELSEWAKKRSDSGLFIDVSDTDTQARFTLIANHVIAADYTPEAKEKFLGCADPWLIAKASVQGSTLVTHEVFSDRKNKIKIPNICRHFKVPYLDTFELLREHAARFILS